MPEIRRGNIALFWLLLISGFVAFIQSVNAGNTSSVKLTNIGASGCAPIRELYSWCSMAPDALSPDVIALWKNAVASCESGNYHNSAVSFAALDNAANGATCGIGGEDGKHDVSYLAHASKLVAECLESRQGNAFVADSFEALARHVVATIQGVQSKDPTGWGGLKSLMGCGMWRHSTQSDFPVIESPDVLIKFRHWASNKYDWPSWRRFPMDQRYPDVAFVPLAGSAEPDKYEYGLNFDHTPDGWTWVGVSLFIVKPFYAPVPSSDAK